MHKGTRGHQIIKCGEKIITPDHEIIMHGQEIMHGHKITSAQEAITHGHDIIACVQEIIPCNHEITSGQKRVTHYKRHYLIAQNYLVATYRLVPTLYFLSSITRRALWILFMIEFTLKTVTRLILPEQTTPLLRSLGDQLNWHSVNYAFFLVHKLPEENKQRNVTSGWAYKHKHQQLQLKI